MMALSGLDGAFGRRSGRPGNPGGLEMEVLLSVRRNRDYSAVTK